MLLLLCSGLSIPATAQNFSHIFRKIDGAVVVITTQEENKTLTDRGMRTTKAKGLGSGIIISPEGLILTAAHVVESADDILVHLNDDSRFNARVIASLSAPDLALIKILEPGDSLPYIRPGSSSKVETGEQVLVIGAPYGLDHTLTVGHLSGRRFKDDTAFGIIEFLQTDAAINQGNSGGPLFSASGELIGIVSHIKSQSGGNEGLGFAASIDMAKRLLLDSPPVWLGADFIILSEDLAKALNAGQNSGMLVQGVSRGSMSEKLGVKPGYIPAEINGTKLLLGGDIITRINGVDVSSSKAGLQKVIKNYQRVKPGDTLTLTVKRRGSEIELSATAE